MGKTRDDKKFSILSLFKQKAAKKDSQPDVVGNAEKQAVIQLAEELKTSLNNQYKALAPTLEKLTDEEKGQFKRSADGMSAGVTKAIEGISKAQTPSELAAAKALVETKVTAAKDLFEKTDHYVQSKVSRRLT